MEIDNEAEIEWSQMHTGSHPAWTPLTVVPSTSHLSCFPTIGVRGLDRQDVEDFGPMQAIPQRCRHSVLGKSVLTP